MELKVVCNCGQKYKFDVEPVDNQMPVTVSCPACGADGTPTANALIAYSTTSNSPPAEPQAQARVTARVVTRPQAVPSPASAKKSGGFSLGRGILGAFLGSLLAAGLVLGISMALGFKLPLFGFTIGLVAGFGAKWLSKGTDRKLGFITAGIALAFTVGALLVLFGGPAFTNVGCIVSMVVSVTMAWKLSAG